MLTRTLERRHQIGLDSYDRMFPNQDTLPKDMSEVEAIVREAQQRGDTIGVASTSTEDTIGEGPWKWSTQQSGSSFPGTTARGVHYLTITTLQWRRKDQLV